MTPAPASSPLACVVGTSRGVVQWDRGIDALDWLTPPTPLQPNSSQHFPNRIYRDVFAIEFHPSQSEVLRFGGRPGLLFTADTRTACTTWSHLKLPSTITHLRCLAGEKQVLVAGLENQLGIYDLRFTRSYRGGGTEDGKIDTGATDGDGRKNGRGFRGRGGRRRGGRDTDRGKTGGGQTGPQGQTVAQPVVRFEDYHNNAHIDIGFAYDADTGVVAAAQDDPPGTVALYSVRTGSRLCTLDLAMNRGSREVNDGNRDGTSSQRRPPAPDQVTNRADVPVIRSLQFEAFPGDHTPTLFVGSDRRGGITAFSFGVENMEDEA